MNRIQEVESVCMNGFIGKGRYDRKIGPNCRLKIQLLDRGGRNSNRTAINVTECRRGILMLRLLQVEFPGRFDNN